MNNEVVSFKAAKKLKEAGFNEICSRYYRDVLEKGAIIPCPNLEEVQKWLREVKGIDITISVYREIDETVSPRIIKRSYECEIITEDDEDYIPYSEDEKNFPSYEAALSAGIDAALDLINNKTE